MRSVWKRDLPPAVRVVTKNVRGQKEALDGSDGREGIDIAGAKALHFYYRVRHDFSRALTLLIIIEAFVAGCPSSRRTRRETWATRSHSSSPPRSSSAFPDPCYPYPAGNSRRIGPLRRRCRNRPSREEARPASVPQARTSQGRK